MTSIRYPLVATLCWLAACDELPAHDDPREVTGYQEAGDCGGLSVRCDERTIAQCGDGCVVQSGCHSTYRDRCASHQTADACEGDDACSYTTSSRRCSALRGISCYSNASQTGCLEDAEFLDCAWGTTCAGDATSCYELEEATGCRANIGCEWTPE